MLLARHDPHMEVAQQRIHHGGDLACWLELPVVRD
jgi:hypothetical protein